MFSIAKTVRTKRGLEYLWPKTRHLHRKHAGGDHAVIDVHTQTAVSRSRHWGNASRKCHTQVRQVGSGQWAVGSG